MMKSPAEIAAMFGCTTEQARQQLLANAEGLEKLHAKAVASGGRKVNGYTAEQLADTVIDCKRAAAS